MKKLSYRLLVITSLLFTITICRAEEQDSPSKNPVNSENVTFNIENTKWHYMDADWQYDLTFLPNNLLDSRHPNDETKDNDSWSQTGNDVYLYFNDKFSTYKGSFINENTLSGTATSTNGSTWKWKAVRIKPLAVE